MKRTGLVMFLCLIATPAFAEGTKKYRPAYEASPEVQKRYEALDAAKRIPLAKAERIRTDVRRVTAVGELVRVEDGFISIRVQVNEKQVATLIAAGAPKHDFVDGWYHQTFFVAPGVDVKHLEGRKARRVRLELATTDVGRRVVIRANFAR